MKRCPHCGKELPVSERTRINTKCIAVRAKTSGTIEHRIVALASRARGVTDDEAAAELGLTHQTATATTSALRRAGIIRFTSDRRETRLGRMARVNVKTNGGQVG